MSVSKESESFEAILRDLLQCVALLVRGTMKDLTSPVWIKAKGLLFLFLGLVSATLLILERPTLRVAALLLLAIWSFCRFYYFAFYVLEHYVDAAYRFSGLLSLTGYLLRSPHRKP